MVLALADFAVVERHPFPAGFRLIGDGFLAPRDPPLSVHLGEDYPMPAGTPIYAPFGGVAVSVNNPSGSFGTYVCIDVPHTPWYVLFAHCARTVVDTGEDIVAGQIIAYSGNTGLSTGPHCHVGVCRNTTFTLDPADYVAFSEFPIRADFDRRIEQLLRG